MNAQNAHEYLPLVQALVDGKTLQQSHAADPASWFDVDEINFGSPHKRYRIKPEPRTFEIVRCKLSCGSIYNEETWDGSNPDIWERITVREVLK